MTACLVEISPGEFCALRRAHNGPCSRHARCDGCGADIEHARTPSGSLMALEVDATPRRRGNLALIDGTAVVYTSGHNATGRPRRMAHICERLR